MRIIIMLINALVKWPVFEKMVAKKNSTGFH